MKSKREERKTRDSECYVKPPPRFVPVRAGFAIARVLHTPHPHSPLRLMHKRVYLRYVLVGHERGGTVVPLSSFVLSTPARAHSPFSDERQVYITASAANGKLKRIKTQRGVRRGGF